MLRELFARMQLISAAYKIFYLRTTLSFLRELFRGVSPIAKYPPCNIHNPKSMHRCFNASLTPRDGVTTTSGSVILVISNLEGSSIWYVLARIYIHQQHRKAVICPFDFSLKHVISLRSATIKEKNVRKRRKERGKEEQKKKKKKRAIAPILLARGANESIQERREIPRSSLGGGDAVGPTGSPGGPSVSFGALVARPRVYRIEDLRRFSESFVHPRTGSRGFSRALGTTTQYTAWQPGPRAAHSLRTDGAWNASTRRACVPSKTHTKTRSLARSPERVCSFACLERTRSTRSQQRARHMVLSCPDEQQHPRSRTRSSLRSG